MDLEANQYLSKKELLKDIGYALLFAALIYLIAGIGKVVPYLILSMGFVGFCLEKMFAFVSRKGLIDEDSRVGIAKVGVIGVVVSAALLFAAWVARNGL